MENKDIGFQQDWLNCRFKYDKIARNKELDKAFLNQLPKVERLQLIDIGAGTGSSFLYWFDKLNQNQDWVFVELDKNLKLACLNRLSLFCAENDYSCSYSDKEDLIRISTPIGESTIRIENNSLLELNSFLDISQFHGITAVAVFDLFTKREFEQFIGLIENFNIPLLASLNYSKTLILGDSENQYYADLYHQHMERLEESTQRMGGRSKELMLEVLSGKKCKFLLGESIWDLNNDAKKMHQFLLNFMKGSIPEILNSSEEIKKFENWLNNQLEESKKGEFNLIVNHWDILANI